MAGNFVGISAVDSTLDAVKEDLETREMLRLFVEDEYSTLNWLCDCCAALSASAPAATALA